MVNFFCIGTQKAGTTTLHDILVQHPQIYLPKQKETHFFCRTDIYNKGIDWYRRQFFENIEGKKCVGEIDPDYLFYSEASERIAQHFSKETKFIVIFRNPVDRALSHYNMTFGRGLEKLSFFQAIRKEEYRFDDEISKMHYSYISRGKYYSQIKKYLKIFSKENFLFLVFERDINDSAMPNTMERVQKFLNVQIVDFDKNERSNVGDTAKYIFINRFIRGNNPLKKLITSFMSKSFKDKLLLKIYSLNKRGVGHIEKLSHQEKKALFEEHYKEDVKQLSDLLGIDFIKIWHE